MKNKILQLIKIFAIVFLIFLFSNLNFFFGSRPAWKDNPGLIMARNIHDYCLKNASLSKGKDNCYAEEFKKLGEQNGDVFSFKVLDSLQRIDPDAIGCHLIAHGIGTGSYKREPENWRILVQNINSSCSYGAPHGVLESYVLTLPEKSLNKDVIPTICGEAPRADCNHIIGHLLLVQTDADVSKALNLCEVFTDPRQNNFCISGVFMEYQTALNLVAHDLVPKSWLNWPPRLGELEKLCRSYSGKYAEGCWEEIVHVALVKFNNDAKTIFDFCSTAQVPNGAKRCKRHSIGIIGASRNFNLASLKSICSLPQKNDPSFEEECYTALVSSALSTIPSIVPEATSFCQSLEKQFQSSCLSMVDAISGKVYVKGSGKIIALQATQDKDKIVKFSPDEFKILWPKALFKIGSQKDNTLNSEIVSIKTVRNIDEQVKLYTKLIERVGPEQAQEDLLRSGLPFDGQTHLLNHTVGDYLYLKYGVAGLSQCKDYFLSSCYHGFILHAIADGGMNKVAEVFASCYKEGSTVYIQCTHAIGHGFLANAGYKNLTQALKICDEAISTIPNFPAFNCYDGVFMENIWAVHDGKPSPDRWIKEDDMEYPCNDKRIDAKYLFGCWSNQPSLVFQLSGGDIKKVADVCSKIKNSGYQETCFNGLARQIHPLTSGEVGKTFELCGLMPSLKWNNYCVFVNATSSYSVGDRTTPFAMCANINGNEKQDCYNQLFSIMRSYAKPGEDIKKLCSKVFEIEWRKKCELSQISG